MMPLYDMMANAQNGEAMREMARRFGLSEEQTRQAVEALMPAFSTGLKRNTQTPQDLAGFMQALAGGRHAGYFDDMSEAASPQGMAEGNGILGHLFGSKEVSRAVAAQASQASGIGQEILKQMLPIIASMLMGGLFKQSTGQMGSASAPAGGGGIFGQMMEEMLRAQTRGFGTDAPDGRPATGGDPFGPLIEGMFGGARREQPGPGAAPDPFDTPLGKIFRDATGGGPSPDTPDHDARPETMPSGRPRNPYDDLFGRMFDTGREVQADYQRGMESIFDTYLKGMDRKR
jgi:hypothetical protein